MKIAAMIFAAGLGTRLYPITKDKPKALVALNGEILLEMIIRKIIAADIRYIVINTHHFAEKIHNFLKSKIFDADIIISHEKEMLLDTAGGLKFAAPFLKDFNSILLHNVDILSDLDFRKMLEEHHTYQNLATLAVSNRQTSRYFLFENQSLQLCGWENRKTGEKIESQTVENYISLAFSGIHIVQSSILDYIPAHQKLSFIPLYLELSKKHSIKGFLHGHQQWMDVGKYEEVNKYFELS
jgi:NDP-sugar pyrophosphorylase family protein